MWQIQSISFAFRQAIPHFTVLYCNVSDRQVELSSSLATRSGLQPVPYNAWWLGGIEIERHVMVSFVEASVGLQQFYKCSVLKVIYNI